MKQLILKQLLLYVVSTVIFCVSLSMPAHAGRILAIAINPNWPPMEMKDKKGKFSGYEIDLIRAMGEAGGFQVRFVEVPWKDIFTGLDKGKYDAVLASVNVTEHRKEKYDFSEPYFTVEQLFVVPKDKAAEPLRGKTIAAFKLTSGAEALRLYQKVSITFYTVEEAEKAFRDLSKGFIEGVLCDSPVALDYSVNNKAYKDRFSTIAGVIPEGVPVSKESYAIAVKKGNAEVLNLINESLRAVKDKGVEAEIRSRWIKTPDMGSCPVLPEKKDVSMNKAAVP